MTDDELNDHLRQLCDDPGTRKLARVSLEGRANHLRTVIASYLRAQEDPVHNRQLRGAAPLLVAVYREALVPINRALLALASEGERDVEPE